MASCGADRLRSAPLPIPRDPPMTGTLHRPVSRFVRVLSATLASGLPMGGLAAQAPATTDSAIVASIPVRAIGPAVFSGRISEIAVASPPGAPTGALGTVLYIAAPTGGVWKSSNGGASWRPVFDDQPIQSVGVVAVAPSEPEIVWAGTGEANNMRSSSWGHGVYRSTDGGERWEFRGLPESQHIGRIVVHPEDPDRVFVAAVGPLWGSGGERGLFRTTDGGARWEAVLRIDEHTGVTDVIFDPSDPEVLYAASLQRQRKPWSYVGGGPGSGIWKSTDGGSTWNRLSTGLPTSDMGRIGLDVSRSDPRIVYAVIEGSEAGVYRSDDRGMRWQKRSDIASIPWFFGQIRVDPSDPDIVYHLGVQLQRSTDGGRSWQDVGRGVHADQHALWINPENPHHLVLGNDGGLYVSRDFAESWDWSPDLPIAQFYDIGIDLQEPFFWVYGGTQDNGTWAGPTRTRDRKGIGNADFVRTNGGDGFYSEIDPVDPRTAYVESQNGFLVRYDRLTGETRPIRPRPVAGDPEHRYNWSAPLLISPHEPRTLYFGAQFLFRSRDRGDRWERISPDLTRALARDSLPMFGRRVEPDAVARHDGTAPYGNLATVAESPLRPGILITGSDDGVIAVSEDGGERWHRVERLPGVPEGTYVSRVIASHHAEPRFYATLDGHRENDFRPYVIRSDDAGRTWTPIHSNLPPSGSVHVIREHPRNPDLLFVGTEFGAFATLNGGASWHRISNGLPAVPVHDLEIHPRDQALVIGTHGRGIFLIDDLTPLELLHEARQAGGGTLFPVLPALQFPLNAGASTGTHAVRNWTAPNPPTGAWLQLFHDSPPRNARVEILDAEGAVLRTLPVAPAAGLQTLVWDFRIESPWSGPPTPARGGSGGGGGGGGGGGSPQPPQVVPGTYRARLMQDSIERMERPVEVRKDPLGTLSDAQLRELFDLRRRLAEAQASLAIALGAAGEAQRDLGHARSALTRAGLEHDGPQGGLSAKVRELDDAFAAVVRRLRGGSGGGGEGAASPAVQTLLGIAAGMNRAAAVPTADEQSALAEAIPLLEEATRELDLLLERLRELEAEMDRAGIPWTPGRSIRTGESRPTEWIQGAPSTRFRPPALAR